MKRTGIVVFWIMILWHLAAVGAAARTITVNDMAGRQVAAPHDPDRIVCLGPGALRLIVYLQAEAKVVGVESMEKRHDMGRPYWIAHPELARLPSCGPGGPASINKKPDLEAVFSVRPQVIFVTYMDASLADDVQEILGIPVVVLSYGALATFDEAVYEALETAGNVLNREQRAGEVVDFIESQRKVLQRRTGNLSPAERPSVYVSGIGYRGARGIESTEQSYVPFDWVNADNMAEEVQTYLGSHVFMDKETLLKLNPEVMFVDGGGLRLVAEDYRKNPDFYDALQAFSKRRVYTLLPFNFYTTNIGTALADAWTIGKILYPEDFAAVDPEEKADVIYTYLVGKPLYTAMEQDYGPIGQVPEFVK